MLAAAATLGTTVVDKHVYYVVFLFSCLRQRHSVLGLSTCPCVITCEKFVSTISYKAPVVILPKFITYGDKDELIEV